MHPKCSHAFVVCKYFVIFNIRYLFVVQKKKKMFLKMLTVLL